MKHDRDNEAGPPEREPAGRPGHHHRHHGHHRRGRRVGRMFDYGELRLLVLAMIAERSRHGYELMRALEERTGGSYSPSPGVIYPTLAWLEDMGFVRIEAEDGGRRSCHVTPDGEAFLAENRELAEGLSARLASVAADERPGEPAPVMRGMENLRLALRLRLRAGPIDQAAAATIAAALDAAAQAVERA